MSRCRILFLGDEEKCDLFSKGVVRTKYSYPRGPKFERLIFCMGGAGEVVFFCYAERTQTLMELGENASKTRATEGIRAFSSRD